MHHRIAGLGGAAIAGCAVCFGLLAGCATAPPGPRDHRPPAGPSSYLAYGPEASSVNQPLTATAATLLDGGRLQVTYRQAGREVTVSGLLTARGAGADPGPAPPIVPLGPVQPGQPAVAPGRAVAIRSVEDWHALTGRLLHEIAALVPDEGVVLDVLRQEEIFLHLDPNGDLVASPLADKPADIRPARVVTLTDLLMEAAERLRASLRADEDAARYILFNTGDVPETGFPFVVIDLSDSRVFFIRQRTADGPVEAQAPVFAAQALMHLVTSHVGSVANRPLSSVTRLISSLGGTAVDYLALPPVAAEEAAIPPLGDAPPMDPEAWESQLDALTGRPASLGRMRHLVDGEGFFPALVHALNVARQSIRMRLFIFDNDDYALTIADLLKRRSREVAVEILVDQLGTLAGGMAMPACTPDFARPPPVSMVAYLGRDSDIAVRTVSNAWLQGDHSKIIIIDDHKAFLGGMNIGREYRYEWHDLMVELQGPVVDDLIIDFEDAWAHAGVLGDLQAVLRQPQQVQRSPRPGDYPVRLLYTLPANAEILRTQIAALRQARQRVWVQNAYLTSDAVLRELIRARRRGVDVRVVLPYENDAGLIGRSNVLAANLMLRNGIRVYIYPGMSHVKAAVFDGWACLGSANFDKLSLRLNRETNIATSHPQAVQELVDRVFTPDFARSVELVEPLPASWLDYLKEAIADHL